MSEINPAAWLHGIDDIRIEPYHSSKQDAVGPAEVKVQVASVGICGSDVHYLKHLRIGDFVVEKPMVLGHESSGIVVEVGSGVTNLKVGDRVAMEPGVPCRCCSICKEGSYNLCGEMKFFATPPVHGSLASFVVHPSDFCYKLPENVSLDEGAMCEPLSVGIHACRRANVQPGTFVAIFGAGPIGLVTLLVAKAFGASNILITDIAEERLSMAKKLGAHHCINVSNFSPSDASQKIIESFGGVRPHVSADCCGFTSSMETALKVTASGGKVCLIGMGHGEMTLPITASAAREVDILGVFRYRNTYPLAIELISKNLIDVKPLITNHIDLADSFTAEKVKEGFDIAATGKSCIKMMFHLVHRTT